MMNKSDVMIASLAGFLLCWGLCWAEDVEKRVVLEGGDITLTCAGTSSREIRILEWVGHSSTSGDEVKVSTCYQDRCKDHDPDNYKSHMVYRRSNSYNSTLIIKAASKMQHHELHCSVYDGNVREVKKTFTISVYSQASSPTCNAKMKGKAAITVTCHTPRVRPGILCELDPMSGDVSIEQDWTYTQEPLAEHEVSANCTIIVQVKRPGDYELEVKMYVIMNGSRVGEATEVIANAVSFRDKKYIEVKQPPVVSLCPGNETRVNLTCTAGWLPSPVDIFRWNPKGGSSKSVKTYDRFYTSVSTYEITPSKNDDGKLFTCTAEYKENHIPSDFHDKLALRLSWPPPGVPVFKYGSSNPTLGRFAKVDDGKNVTITCEVDGGKPEVSSVHVVCRFTNRSTTSQLRVFKSEGKSLSFNLTGLASFYMTHCMCYAQHETQCYDKKTMITFYTSEGPSEQWNPPNNQSIIFYILAATIGFVFIPLVIGTLCFLRGRWQNLYDYFYSSSSVRTLSSAYYASVRFIARDSNTRSANDERVSASFVHMRFGIHQPDSITEMIPLNSLRSTENDYMADGQPPARPPPPWHCNEKRNIKDGYLEPAPPAHFRPTPDILNERPPPLPFRRRSRSFGSLRMYPLDGYGKVVESIYDFSQRPPPLPHRMRWNSEERLASTGMSFDRAARTETEMLMADTPQPLKRRPYSNSESDIYGYAGRGSMMEQWEGPPPLPRKPEWRFADEDMPDTTGKNPKHGSAETAPLLEATPPPIPQRPPGRSPNCSPEEMNYVGRPRDIECTKIPLRPPPRQPQMWATFDFSYRSFVPPQNEVDSRPLPTPCNIKKKRYNKYSFQPSSSDFPSDSSGHPSSLPTLPPAPPPPTYRTMLRDDRAFTAELEFMGIDLRGHSGSRRSSTMGRKPPPRL